MKHLNKLSLLAVLLIFASCQNEKLTEDSMTAQEEAALEKQIIVSDGEEDASLILNAESENLVTRSLTLSSSSSNHYSSYSSSGCDDSGYKHDHGDHSDCDDSKKYTCTGDGYYHDRGYHDGCDDDDKHYDDEDNEPTCVADLAGLESSLPDAVSAQTIAKPGTDSYFTLQILDTDLLARNIPAWCADQDLSLGVEGPLNFDVYSSYETLPAGVFEFPENFPQVNWLLNQDIIGTQSSTGGTYTFGHIQYAIWLLIDDSVCQVCTYMTSPTGLWNSDPNNVTMAQELADLANANGTDFIPSCGEKAVIVLVPEGKQALIITKEVPELIVEEECSDCEGKVSELTLEFDWYNGYNIKVYQKYENTCYGVKIFDGYVGANGTFSFAGANSDGSMGEYAYVYLNGCYYTKISTDCDINIGPGYSKGVLNVLSGASTQGGELCEYVKEDYNKCYRHWECQYYSSCKYNYYGGH